MNFATIQNSVMLIDADNTLWDTDSVFANAQLTLLTQLESVTGIAYREQDRLSFIRQYDQALAARHHLHLKYPVQMLVSTVVAGLNRQTAEEAAIAVIGGRHLKHSLEQSLIEESVSIYTHALRETPNLLPTVESGLRVAQERNIAMFVMTEGRVEQQRRVMETHNLSQFFAGVWEMNKDTEQFERLRRRFDPASIIVIGDQADRDIVPAKRAGCVAVLVPSRFRPNWNKEGDDRMADFVAERFLDAINWSIRKSSGNGASASAENA